MVDWIGLAKLLRSSWSALPHRVGVSARSLDGGLDWIGKLLRNSWSALPHRVGVSARSLDYWYCTGFACVYALLADGALSQ